jgi:hypothetical protein
MKSDLVKLAEFSKLSIEELNNKSVEDIFSYFPKDGIAFVEFFWNTNSAYMNEDKIIQLLEIFKKDEQRFYDQMMYYVLFHTKKVQEWVIKNLKPYTDNPLYIQDHENY